MFFLVGPQVTPSEICPRREIDVTSLSIILIFMILEMTEMKRFGVSAWLGTFDKICLSSVGG
jgi:hypothetical protein